MLMPSQVQEGKEALSFLRSQMALYGKQKAGADFKAQNQILLFM